jgi:hypothetical protein
MVVHTPTTIHPPLDPPERKQGMDGGNRNLPYAAPTALHPQSTALITTTLNFKYLKDSRPNNVGKDS